MATPGNLEARLEASHKHLCRAGFWVVIMLVKRVFVKSYSEKALTEARRAVAILENLGPRRNQSSEE